MQTPETLNQLGDDELRVILDGLAQEYFKTHRWKTMLSEASGYSYPAVKSWSRDTRPPVIVIMWLESELRRGAYEGMLISLGRIVNVAQDLA